MSARDQLIEKIQARCAMFARQAGAASVEAVRCPNDEQLLRRASELVAVNDQLARAAEDITGLVLEAWPDSPVKKPAARKRRR